MTISGVGGVTTSYLLDKNRPYAQVLEEYEDGSSVASYAYGLDLLEQERAGLESTYLVDELGSTRVLLDEAGEVAAAYSYDAYGNLVGEPGAVENAYRFAGEQWDEELGQYYLRQRYYDPTTGRFTRRDTWEGDNSNPITLNKHIYANADPVNGIDPSGLFTTTEIKTTQKIQNILANLNPVVRAGRLIGRVTSKFPLPVVRVLARTHAISQTVPPNIEKWGIPVIVSGGYDLPETTRLIGILCKRSTIPETRRPPNGKKKEPPQSSR